MTIKNLLLIVFALTLIGSSALYTQELDIKQISTNCFVYTTYKMYNGNKTPSNSMYVLTDSGVVMLDTPWDSTQVQQLLDSIRIKHFSEVVLCIPTHFHDDRTAGLGVLNRMGIPTISTEFTRLLCEQNNEPQAAATFPGDTVITIGNCKFEVYYPGRGHAPDNIVVWLPQEKVLYGGCLIKSLESTGIGNTSDANLPEWEKSVAKVIERYKEIAFVVPGHFTCGGPQLLPHTIGIIKNEMSKVK